jgi:beta-galactosidase
MTLRIPALALLFGYLTLTACEKTPVDPPVAKVTDPFPEGFLWGTATAGFQVDMGCPTAACPDLVSDWYQWATDEDIIEAGLTNGDPLEDGPGHWELFASDYDLAVNKLHNNAYRMSMEWSRLFTTSTENATTHAELKAIADPVAVAHYHDMFQAMRDRGITPMVTLIHYSMPTWIHDGVACHKDPEGCENRGWLDGERLIPEMAKYAGFAAREYGDKVDLWATLNEPYAVVLAGYVVPSPERTNPPGISDLSFTYARTVIHNMIVAHARMYDAIHANDEVDADGDGPKAQVGLVPNLAPVVPKDPHRELDVLGAANAHILYNRYFLDPLILGDWDEDFDGVSDAQRDDLKGRMDFVGINYYTTLTVSGLGKPLAKEIPLTNFLPDTKDLFAPNPNGLYHAAKFVKDTYNLPIYITENGTVNSLTEPKGATFLVNHLIWMRKAIADGVDIRGYFYWSLVDNYEWNHGYGMQFGAFSYDTVTKERTLKKLGQVYGTIAKGNSIPQAVLDEYATE